MKYRPMMFCEHANETPRSISCPCTLDCGCRQYMCRPKAKRRQPPMVRSRGAVTISDLKGASDSLKKQLDRVEDIRRVLSRKCKHPPEYVSDYQWEHDNGYGRQTMMTGRYCQVCRKKDLWNQGNWNS